MYRSKEALVLLLLLTGSLNFVVAQSNSGTCYVTPLDTTVTQFCYASLQNNSQGSLNFTVVNDSNTSSVTLKFKPLPGIHQVELEAKDDSDGLKGWASLANSFVNSVRSGSLPYGTVCKFLSYNSRDSGWAWRAFSRVNNTGSICVIS